MLPLVAPIHTWGVIGIILEQENHVVAFGERVAILLAMLVVQ